MVRRLCILCFLVALWPGFALAQSAALLEAFNQSPALYEQGRYGEAERFALLKPGGADHPVFQVQTPSHSFGGGSSAKWAARAAMTRDGSTVAPEASVRDGPG